MTTPVSTAVLIDIQRNVVLKQRKAIEAHRRAQLMSISIPQPRSRDDH